MAIPKIFSLRRAAENARVRLVGKYAQSLSMQRLYGRAEYLLGRIALGRKRYFRAADHFCKASRRVKKDTKSRQRARAQLRAFFQPADRSALRVATVGDFLRTREAARLRERFAHRAFPLNVTLAETMLPLKAWDPSTQEKGVLLLTYNYTYRAFHALFQTEKLKDYYSVVLEPSFTHVEDAAYTMYQGWDIVLLDRIPFVRSGIQWLGQPFETVPLNAGDWVDPDTFFPASGTEKVYDLILVANYGRYKRHELLFATLAKIRRPLRVALVGSRWLRTRQDIEALMKEYGVAERCEIFERLSFAELNRMFNRSRINVMISSGFETANRAMYEAMYADLPSIVNRDCEGIDLSYINEHTGVQVSDAELAGAILETLDHPKQFSPRAWAMEHCHYARSTRILNDKLREMNLARGYPWTVDIAAKVNRSDPVYKFEADAERLRPVLDHLAGFLRPDARERRTP